MLHVMSCLYTALDSSQSSRSTMNVTLHVISWLTALDSSQSSRSTVNVTLHVISWLTALDSSQSSRSTVDATCVCHTATVSHSSRLWHGIASSIHHIFYVSSHFVFRQCRVCMHIIYEYYMFDNIAYQVIACIKQGGVQSQICGRERNQGRLFIRGHSPAFSVCTTCLY